MTQTPVPSIELATLCARTLDDKKAIDLRVLDVGGVSSLTNYLVIATATSEPHLRALRVELEKAVDTAAARIVGMETAGESGWVVVDLFDVMVHLFTAERRALYNLERLWRDSEEIPVSRLLAPPPAAAPAPAASASAAPKAKAPAPKAPAPKAPGAVKAPSAKAAREKAPGVKAAAAKEPKAKAAATKVPKAKAPAKAGAKAKASSAGARAGAKGGATGAAKGGPKGGAKRGAKAAPKATARTPKSP